MTHVVDVVVIGGGQAGFAAGYHLRRQNLDFVILERPALTGRRVAAHMGLAPPVLPGRVLLLPGWLMPAQDGAEYPDAHHAVEYLTAYEERYTLPVVRPVRAKAVHRDSERLRVETDAGVEVRPRRRLGHRNMVAALPPRRTRPQTSPAVSSTPCSTATLTSSRADGSS
ncbi:hypothetical protein SMICM17S_03728 [Streptomyces microflavus]